MIFGFKELSARKLKLRTERYIQLLATWLSAPAVIPNEARGLKRSSVPCCAAPRRAKLVLEQEYGRYFASVSRQKPDAGKGDALARFGLDPDI